MKGPVAVVGAGNVGRAIAGHLAIMGGDVRLYSPVGTEIEAIRARRGIQLTGVVDGFGCPKALTTDLREAVTDAQLVMVAAPGFAHSGIARELAGVLDDDQVVVFQPGVLGSAVELVTETLAVGRGGVIAAETDTSLYTCRMQSGGEVFIGAIKEAVGVAAIPAGATSSVVDLLVENFGDRYVPQVDTLAVGLGNINPVYHCPPVIVSFGLIEKAADQAFHELVSPSIGRLINAVDAERLNLGRALGIELRSFWQFLADVYAVNLDNQSAFDDYIRQAYGRQAFRAPTSAEHRYITEDIPYGLVPWSALARQVGVPMPLIDGMIDIASALVGIDFRSSGRSLASLRMTELSSPAEIRSLFTHGPQP